VVSILTRRGLFSNGDFSLTSIGDVKPENGLLGPSFIGAGMRRVVVGGDPFTPAAKGGRHAGRDAWSSSFSKSFLMISVVQHN
jgi:hypothetical protein